MSDDQVPSMGNQLTMHRESKKMSMRKLAKRVGVSATYICDIELGRRFPRRSAIMKEIEKALSIPTGSLEDLNWMTAIESMKRRARKDPAYGLTLVRMMRKDTQGDRVEMGAQSPMVQIALDTKGD